MNPLPKNPIIGIIGGHGKMGSYFADVFIKNGYKVIISDRNTKLTNQKLAAKADVVIVSVPIDQTGDVIKKIAQSLRRDALLMDLTSLKQFPIKEMLKAKSEVIGLHPMFGPTNPLKGQTIITCPVRSKKWYPWVKNLLLNEGALITELTPKVHDEIMGVVQGMVHFADIAFGHALKELKIPVEKYLQFAGPASELKIAFVGRLLAQDPKLYASIELENPQALKAISQYAKSINQLMQIDRNKDLAGFVKYFKSAGKSLENYKKTAFNDTNYLINAILKRRSGQNELKTRSSAPTPSKATSNAEIAILGPKNTYSDLAAQKCGGNKAKSTYCKSIAEVFNMVEIGKAKQGIIPLENIIYGTVRETLDELYKKNVHIVAKFNFPVHHAIVTLPETQKKDIESISSHEQALHQCGKYLSRNFPGARQLQATSTMAAFETMIGERDTSTATIIPYEIAKKLNCKVIAHAIGDNPKNRTTFIAIKKGPAKLTATPTSKNKSSQTSIAFTFGKDRPGALSAIFREFADAKINLSRIESRPSTEELGKYIFYMDFIGNPKEDRTKKVLKNISDMVAKLKILGVY